jgi:ABC-2 type transport system ATP-binding protein
VISIAHVSKSLGGRRIIDDVTFDVDRGVVALLGRNGAGKTTLMRMLSGIWQPDAGSIAIGGSALASDPVGAKKQLGFQPEFPDLHPSMRARELLDFVAASREVSPAMLDAAIARFEAKDLVDQRTGKLSQGQKRVITLIAATMHDPPLLLLDEPTNALDPHRVAALKAYLATPRTALISTHQLDFVVTIATQFILLREGRVVGQGTLEELRAQVGMARASLEEIVLKAT